MPLSDGRCLAKLLLAACGGRDGDSIADAEEARDLRDLARRALASPLRQSMRGKTVLIATGRQLPAVAAMMALDGAARRIILWPPDEKAPDPRATMAACDADAAVTGWPPEANGADNAVKGDEAAVDTEWILLTSGSTGAPKRVTHNLQSLAGHLAGKAPPAAAAPVWFTFYDVRRYGGLQFLLRGLLGGGSIVLSSQEETPAALLRRAAGAGATHVLGTPSHWRRALMTPPHALLSPVYVRLSGEVVNQSILDQLAHAYPRAALVHAFASTEAGLGFEVADGRQGFPAAFFTAPPDGVDLRVHEGTLWLRSARCAGGAGAFVDTGDEVERRGERYFFIGRRDGVINVGGQKVHPEEVESVINQHPAVRMSRVAGKQSPMTGAIVVADIVQHEAAGQAMPAGMLEAEVMAFCRRLLPRHKVPVLIRLVAQLPIAASGKLVRKHA